jgi:hypothetical protein
MSLHQQAIDAIPYRLETHVDHKAWAKRIVWREKKGDKTLLSIQIRFAHEALDIKTEEQG